MVKVAFLFFVWIEKNYLESQGANKLITEYVNKDRRFYNQIPSSKKVLKVPEIGSAKPVESKILNDWLAKSLNEMLMDSKEEKHQSEHQAQQLEIITEPSAYQITADSQEKKSK